MAFQFTDYIFTPGDLFRGSSRLIKKISWRDLIATTALVLVFIMLKIYLGWQADTAFLLIFAVALLYWNISFKVSASFGLISLIFYPFLLLLSDKGIVFLGDNWENRIAVWVYAFLAIAIASRILEYRKEKKEDRGEKKGSGKKRFAFPEIPEDNIDLRLGGHVLDLRKIKNRRIL